MGEEDADAVAAVDAPPPPSSSSPSWQAYISEELPRNVRESAGSAVRSARSFGQSSSIHLQSLQEFVPELGSRYKYYEEAFFHKVKDGLLGVREQPALVGGVAVASLLLMRGPRRFLFRQTLGRFQSEEARFGRAEKNVKDFSISVEVMKNESRKLLERSVFAEKDMKRGHSGLRDAGTQIQSLSRSFRKAETAATDLMSLLREIPGREAIKLRADVASMASHLQQQRSAMDKRLLKISNFGIPA